MESQTWTIELFTHISTGKDGKTRDKNSNTKTPGVQLLLRQQPPAFEWLLNKATDIASMLCYLHLMHTGSL